MVTHILVFTQQFPRNWYPSCGARQVYISHIHRRKTFFLLIPPGLAGVERSSVADQRGEVSW